MPGTYSTDLTTLTAADATTGYTAVGTFSVNPRADTGLKVQGTNGLIGSGPSVANDTVWWKYTFTAVDFTASDRHIFPWVNMTTLGVADTKANGGVRIAAGSGAGTASGTFPTDGLTAGRCWRVDGVDTNRYGGWKSYCVYPNAAGSFDTGTPAINAVVWIAVGLRSTAAILDTTFNFCVDALRYGTGHTVTGGTTGAPVTYEDHNTWDAENTRVYGVLIKQGGIFYQSGKFTYGATGQVAVTVFKATGITLVFPDNPVKSDFYAMIGLGAASFPTTVTHDQCTIFSAGAAKWTVTANANSGYVFTNCSLRNILTLTLNSLSSFSANTVTDSTTLVPTGVTATNCKFQNCAAITLTGTSAAISGGSTVGHATAINVPFVTTNSLAKISNHAFSNTGGTGHAAEINTAGSYAYVGNTHTGYGADGSSSAAIYNNSGGAVEITISGGGDTPTVRNGAGASTTIVAGAVTVKVTATTATGTAIQSAIIHLRASSGAGPFPYLASVTITRAGTVATVAHTTHGMATNDKILLRGITDKVEDNAVQQITNINANSYSYTTTNTGSTSYTGTITSTFVALDGLTDVNGEISTSRVYSSNQPVTGWSRKSSGAPFLKEGPINGTILAASGFNQAAVMVPDE